MLYYHHSMEAVAHKIVQCSNGSVQLGKIDWKNFRDGWPNLYIRDAESIRDRKVAFLASIFEASDLFEQIAVIYCLPRLGVSNFMVSSLKIIVSIVKEIDTVLTNTSTAFTSLTRYSFHIFQRERSNELSKLGRWQLLRRLPGYSLPPQFAEVDLQPLQYSIYTHCKSNSIFQTTCTSSFALALACC